MDNQKNTKSSRGAIAAGLFIALYLVTYVIIGAICMPVAVLFLLMPELVAFFAAPIYHTMLTKAPGWISIFLAAVIPSLFLIATGHIPLRRWLLYRQVSSPYCLQKKGNTKALSGTQSATCFFRSIYSEASFLFGLCGITFFSIRLKAA